MLANRFRFLADQLQQKFGLRAKTDYSVLQQGVLLRNHYSLIKAEYLRQWVLQGGLSPSDREALSRETRLLSKGFIRLAVIKIDSPGLFCNKYDFNSQKLLKDAMGNIAEKWISDSGRAVEFVDFGTNLTVVLIGEANWDSDLEDCLTSVLREAEQCIGQKVTMAVSDARRIHDNLRKAYDDICELVKFKFICGVDKIYTEKDYEHYLEKSDGFMDDAKIEQLIQSVRSGKMERTLSALEELFEHLRTLKYSECRFQLSLLFFAIAKSFHKLTSIQSFESIESHLERFSTLVEVGEWTKEELARIMCRLTSVKGFSRKEKVVEEMAEYVRYHIHDPKLSIEGIAEHVSLSVNYVRQLFDEVRGVSLSAYILNARIEQVKELLGSTDLTVADISGQSGFQTKSHFFTAFKKATGMTPSQYRTQYASESKT